MMCAVDIAHSAELWRAAWKYSRYIGYYQEEQLFQDSVSPWRINYYTLYTKTFNLSAVLKVFYEVEWNTLLKSNHSYSTLSNKKCE